MLKQRAGIQIQSLCSFFIFSYQCALLLRVALSSRTGVDILLQLANTLECICDVCVRLETWAQCFFFSDVVCLLFIQFDRTDKVGFPRSLIQFYLFDLYTLVSRRFNLFGLAPSFTVVAAWP